MAAVGPSFEPRRRRLHRGRRGARAGRRILLVAAGEMGRTPRINKNGGRDHWAKLAPLAALRRRGGARQGRRPLDPRRRRARSEGFATPNLVSTILHTAFDVGRLRLRPEFAAITKLAEAAPIPAGP
jgi:uncharacterized protein (DUF1501 family)